MPTSQFTFYSSSDTSAPQLTGAAGSLLAVLDAVLVNGYGSKTPAGWTKPIANSGNVGHYKQGAGSGFYVHINDNGPNGTSTFKEAWATGWETMSAITAPVGVGGGQFPLPSQLLTTGHTVVRKSNTADAVVRLWSCFADAYTFYFFCEQVSATGQDGGLFFGDIFSIRTGGAETGRCIIIGGDLENSASSRWEATNSTVAVVAGHYMARGWGGVGGSVAVGKYGNASWSAAGTSFTGVIPAPNGPDNSVYLTPIVIYDSVKTIRGRLRGVYHVAHPITTYAEGAVISGTGDNAGKVFQIGPAGLTGTSAYLAFETSATVETN